ncbi:hypothetical protein MRB53_021128 [Persea americana]|uniref:Uncharacterized protein n=1 Tax=Persea americana TaxID=3435 RepID=A0ACC2L2R0_PERAE|nr:hypothetical protein MRB53_021128 [Persea americana]
MASFLNPQFLTHTISSNRPFLHRSILCAHKPDSQSSPTHRRRILIGLGGSLLLSAAASSSLFSRPRTDPLHPTVQSQHPNSWPTIFQMDAAEASTIDGEFPCVLDSVVKATVKRPKKAKRGEEEVLVVDGIEVFNNVPVKFDVLINVADWRTCGPGSSEFAGSFVHVPRKPWDPEGKVKTRLRLGITDLLEQIGADRDDEFTVTFVPRAGNYVRVGGVRIEYSS